MLTISGSGPVQVGWSQEFAIGHLDLDNEHRRLVDAVNTIYGATSAFGPGVLSRLLDELLHLVREHFRHENTLLLQIKHSPIPTNIDQQTFLRAAADADLDQHIANHSLGLRQLSAIIHNIRVAIEQGKFEINSELKEWLIKHMTGDDAHLKPMFAALKQPGE